jgi:hypothetical protein
MILKKLSSFNQNAIYVCLLHLRVLCTKCITLTQNVDTMSVCLSVCLFSIGCVSSVSRLSIKFVLVIRSKSFRQHLFGSHE